MLQVGSKTPKKIAKKTVKKAGNVKAPARKASAAKKSATKKASLAKKPAAKEPSPSQAVKYRREGCEESVCERERACAREERLASQGRPKEGTRLKVMWGGKFYSCSVVKTRQR